MNTILSVLLTIIILLAASQIHYNFMRALTNACDAGIQL